MRSDDLTGNSPGGQSYKDTWDNMALNVLSGNTPRDTTANAPSINWDHFKNSGDNSKLSLS
jgi:hypothetical protein